VGGQREAGESRSGGLAAAWVTDVGCIREENQDRCAADAERGLLIVSDGMGGELAGGQAAGLVVNWLPDVLFDKLRAAAPKTTGQIEDVLKDAILELNRHIWSESLRMPTGGKMGATVVMALARGRRLHVANLGDSRAYRLSGEKLEQLTRDHSVVSTLVRRGVLTPEEAENHPMSGRLSRYLGMDGNASADVRTIEWRPEDRLLLCSDGLTGEVADERIRRILVRRDALGDTCNALTDAAIENGGRDNVTVLVARRTR